MTFRFSFAVCVEGNSNGIYNRNFIFLFSSRYIFGIKSHNAISNCFILHSTFLVRYPPPSPDEFRAHKFNLHVHRADEFPSADGCVGERETKLINTHARWWPIFPLFAMHSTWTFLFPHSELTKIYKNKNLKQMEIEKQLHKESKTNVVVCRYPLCSIVYYYELRTIIPFFFSKPLLTANGVDSIFDVLIRYAEVVDLQMFTVTIGNRHMDTHRIHRRRFVSHHSLNVTSRRISTLRCSGCCSSSNVKSVVSDLELRILCWWALYIVYVKVYFNFGFLVVLSGSE